MRNASHRKTKRILEDKHFKDVVVIEPRDIAFAIAAKEVDTYLSKDRLVFWADASNDFDSDGSHKIDSDGGIGIAYHSSKCVCSDLSWHVRGQNSTNLFEMSAIARALEIAWDIGPITLLLCNTEHTLPPLS